MSPAIANPAMNIRFGLEGCTLLPQSIQQTPLLAKRRRKDFRYARAPLISANKDFRIPRDQHRHLQPEGWCG
jgi:hypothetical protein